MGAVLMSIDELNAAAQRVFIWTGNVIHLIDLTAPMLPDETPERRSAACGTRPYWPANWFPGEHEKAINFPVCGRCKNTMEAYAGD